MAAVLGTTLSTLRSSETSIVHGFAVISSFVDVVEGAVSDLACAVRITTNEFRNFDVFDCTV
jgi:hypothetical protein